MPFPLWVPWTIAAATALTALIATYAEPRKPAARWARWWPVPVVATIVAISMSADRAHLSEEEVHDALDHAATRTPDSIHDEIDKIIGQAELELGRDLTWTSSNDAAADPDDSTYEHDYTVYPQGSAKPEAGADPDDAKDAGSRDPVVCVEVRLYRQLEGVTTQPASYSLSSGACDTL